MNQEIQPRTFDETKVINNFAGASVTYDLWAKTTESKAMLRVLEWANLDGDQSILEVAIGTGILFEKLVQKNVRGFTTGIDLSPDMLEKACSRTAHYKNVRNFELQVGSAYGLPFDAQQFDVLISNYMLDLLPKDDFVLILNEFKRVLKPDGQIILSSMTFVWKWYQKHWEWLTATFPEMMTQCRPIDLEPFVKEAGFKVEKVERISQNTFPTQVIRASKKDR